MTIETKEQAENEFSIRRKGDDIEITIDKLKYYKRIVLALRTLLCLKPLVIFRKSKFKFLKEK